MSAINFRPLGIGVLPQPFRAYRSGEIADVSTAEANYVRNRLHVGTYIDLRSKSEQQAMPPRNLVANGIEWRQVPMIGADETCRKVVCPTPSGYIELYIRMLSEDRKAMCNCITLLAERTGTGAVIFGCRAGKARTGIVSALVLGMLGATDEEITRDFVRSRSFLVGSLARFKTSWESKGIDEADYAVRMRCSR